MSQEYKRHQSFPLRLSPSLRQVANDLAHKDGISLNQFINLAVAEKVTKLEVALQYEHSAPKRAINFRPSLRTKEAPSKLA